MCLCGNTDKQFWKDGFEFNLITNPLRKKWIYASPAKNEQLSKNIEKLTDQFSFLFL